MGIPRPLKIILPNPDKGILGFPMSGGWWGGGGRFGPLVKLGILVNKRFFSAMPRTLQCGRLIHGKSASIIIQLQ